MLTFFRKAAGFPGWQVIYWGLPYNLWMHIILLSVQRLLYQHSSDPHGNNFCFGFARCSWRQDIDFLFFSFDEYLLKSEVWIFSVRTGIYGSSWKRSVNLTKRGLSLPFFLGSFAVRGQLFFSDFLDRSSLRMSFSSQQNWAWMVFQHHIVAVIIYRNISSMQLPLLQRLPDYHPKSRLKQQCLKKVH